LKGQKENKNGERGGNCLMKVRLRRSVLLLAITMLIVLVLSIPSVQATVYSAHAQDSTGNWHVKM
jgi:heme/copper-type cytochrome/quinol oxidase subunit 2